MMNYSRLFETVRRRLEFLGLSCEVQRGDPVTGKALSKTEGKMKISLPAELREFYRTVGDGCLIHWSADPENPNKPFASVFVPPLSDLVNLYSNWRGLALYSAEAAEKYGFPYTDDPALAKRTAAKMWHWLPVLEEGNGDLICIDLGDPKCPVIFNKHDWLDGGSGDDGHLLEPSWGSFLSAWAAVCFQSPKSLYWPSCFRPSGGVDWEGQEFLAPFRLDRLAETG